MPAGELTESKDTRQVHFQHCRPIVVGKLDRGSATNDSGVVNQDIETSKMIDCFFDEVFSGLRLAQITRYRKSMLDLFASGMRRVGVAVAGDPRARFAKRDGDSSTESS